MNMVAMRGSERLLRFWRGGGVLTNACKNPGRIVEVGAKQRLRYLDATKSTRARNRLLMEMAVRTAVSTRRGPHSAGSLEDVF